MIISREQIEIIVQVIVNERLYDIAENLDFELDRYGETFSEDYRAAMRCAKRAIVMNIAETCDRYGAVGAVSVSDNLED